MGLRINLNTAAMTAHRLLSETDGSLGKTIERLSSGFRINAASDDPAGLVISEKLRAQVGGLAVAIRNAGDAVNMVRTAEAALNEVSRMLRSMRDLAVHAANAGANDLAAVQADQAQIINSILSLEKIAQETQFGQKKLLDGTAGITASISGQKVVAGDISNPAVTFKNNDAIFVNITQAAQRATVNLIDLGSSVDTVTQNGRFYINGVAIDYTSGVDTAYSLADKINALSSQTGVTASIQNEGQVTLYSVKYGENAKIMVTSSDDYILGATSLTNTGQDAQAQVRVGSSWANAVDVSDTTWSAGEGLVLRDSRGNQIVLKEAAGTTVTGTATEEFRVNLGTMKFQVGAYAQQIREVNIKATYPSNLGTGAVPGQSVATIDLTTYEGAQNAILILDEAIREISTIRAELGATQKNVFESSIASLTVAKENIAASESTIRDTDMAAEIVNLTRNQILQQSGIAMLAQANQAPQSLLKLLQ